MERNVEAVRAKVVTVMRWYAQDEVNQEDSEQNEVDGMKKGAERNWDETERNGEQDSVRIFFVFQTFKRKVSSSENKPPWWISYSQTYLLTYLPFDRRRKTIHSGQRGENELVKDEMNGNDGTLCDVVCDITALARVHCTQLHADRARRTPHSTHVLIGDAVVGTDWLIERWAGRRTDADSTITHTAVHTPNTGTHLCQWIHHTRPSLTHSVGHFIFP